MAFFSQPSPLWMLPSKPPSLGLALKYEPIFTNATITHRRLIGDYFALLQVNPPAPIYFYQFTSPANASDLQWVTRFLIAGADGSSTAATGSQGGVAFGNGAFVDPSLYNAPPSYLAGNGQLIGGSNGNGGGSSAPVPTGTGTSALPTTTVTPTGTQSQSVPSQPTSTNSEGGSAKSSITFSVITVKPTGSGTSKSASPSTTTASASGASSLVSMSSPWGVLLGALIAGVTAAASL